MTDEEFVRQFEACTLPPSEFHHRNHVRLAWLLMRDESFEEASEHFIRSLKRYATSLGKSTLYHETITRAYLMFIRDRRKDERDFDAFAEANADLFEKDFLLRYYTAETLASDEARTKFIKP